MEMVVYFFCDSFTDAAHPLDLREPGSPDRSRRAARAPRARSAGRLAPSRNGAAARSCAWPRFPGFRRAANVQWPLSAWHDARRLQNDAPHRATVAENTALDRAVPMRMAGAPA